MHARMTLIGMETELQANNKSFADDWELTNQTYDKDTLLACIIQTGASFEPLYADPDYFHLMSAMWWKRWKRTFEKWFDAFDLEYNPLENYDRQEQWHEDTLDTGSESTEHSQTTTVDDDSSYAKQGADQITEEGTGAYSKSGSDDEQLSGKDQVDHDYNKDIDTENSVSAFDSSSYSPHDKTHTDDVLTAENTDTTYGRKSDRDYSESGESEDSKETNRSWSESGTAADDSKTDVEGTSATDRSNDRDFDHTGRIHGNIGVTTSQQMLESELKVQGWNIYQHMTDIFCREMLVSVY